MDTIDLSAGPADTALTEATTKQFRRDLSHILIDLEGGPEIVLGEDVLRFKSAITLDALAELLSETNNRLDAMRNYVNLALASEEDRQAFAKYSGRLDMDGLGEIINVLGEAYTSFPEKS